MIWMKLLDTLMVYMKDFFFGNNFFFETKSANDKNMLNYPVGKELNDLKGVYAATC